MQGKDEKGRSAIGASQEKNVHAGHRQRLRERFDTAGSSGFEEHTILELLLFYAIPQKDTNPLAHDLIQRFGSLEGVLNASKEELMQVSGVGENTATLLRLVEGIWEVCARSKTKEKVVLDSSSKTGEFVREHLHGRQRETMVVLCLDNQMRLVRLEELGSGISDSTTASFREIAQLCMRLNINNMILAHNHPSGLVYPSKEDIVVTRKMKDLLKEINVKLHDHFIVTENEFYSMRDHKLF